MGESEVPLRFYKKSLDFEIRLGGESEVQLRFYKMRVKRIEGKKNITYCIFYMQYVIYLNHPALQGIVKPLPYSLSPMACQAPFTRKRLPVRTAGLRISVRSSSTAPVRTGVGMNLPEAVSTST